MLHMGQNKAGPYKRTLIAALDAYLGGLEALG